MIRLTGGLLIAGLATIAHSANFNISVPTPDSIKPMVDQGEEIQAPDFGQGGEGGNQTDVNNGDERLGCYADVSDGDYVYYSPFGKTVEFNFNNEFIGIEFGESDTPLIDGQYQYLSDGIPFAFDGFNEYHGICKSKI